jgi:hypothetical protein
MRVSERLAHGGSILLFVNSRLVLGRAGRDNLPICMPRSANYKRNKEPL